MYLLLDSILRLKSTTIGDTAHLLLPKHMIMSVFFGKVGFLPLSQADIISVAGMMISASSMSAAIK